MPLGIQRLNAGNSHPNDRIVFIKPLPGPDSQTALDFLNRIAAICAPIMRSNHLSVMSLEEFEPNREFVGRNFNAGEVIQLVLKAPGTNRWLPFRYVQMVMMHELAHCMQMNHSRAFWAVRNQYAGELRGLWEKSYTGDGFWGRGQRLYDGQYSEGAMPASDYMPENLCGGTYRSSRGRKRKRGSKESSKLTYAERKQRRLAKKFGKDWETSGRVLGEDEVLRYGLEQGKRVQGNPRVAKSKRGRELRAAAALARLEQANHQKKLEEQSEASTRENTSDTDSDFDDSDKEIVDIKQEATEPDGTKIVDRKGRGMVKVCGDEDTRDQDAQQEMKELGDIKSFSKGGQHAVPLEEASTTEDESDQEHAEKHQISSPQVFPGAAPKIIQATSNKDSSKFKSDSSSKPKVSDLLAKQVAPNNGQTLKQSPNEATDPEQICTVCSFVNNASALTCAVCAHVLDTERLPRFWRCDSQSCRGGAYVNSEDVGVCGACGQSRSGV